METIPQSSKVPAVIVERTINAPREIVFEALTDARHLERWFFTECETDPRPGGSYRMQWKHDSDESMNHERFGKYLEFSPPERVVFEWRGFKGDPDVITRVAITLAADGDRTRLELVHDGWPETDAWREQRDAHDKGWLYYADNLDSVLSGGADARVGSGQRTKRG